MDTTKVRGVHAVAMLLAAVAVLSPAGAVEAKSPACASEPVVARGDHGRFQWVAKAKARAAWRRKVRLLPALGVAYADWASASETEERCIASERSVYCIFSGVPCRK